MVNRARCVEAVQRALRGQTAETWKTRCESAGVPVGLVRTVREALAETDASPVTGAPSSVGGVVRRRPPRLGEHSAEIALWGWRGVDRPRD